MLALLGVATVSLAVAGLAWGHRNEHGAATLASEVVAAVGYAIVAFAVWERLRQSNVFATGPGWFCIAEIALVTTAVAAFAYWGQWWIDGERFTGVIAEIDDIEHVVIRDPGTERSVEASLSIWPWDDFEVGDTTTVLIDRDDPSHGRSRHRGAGHDRDPRRGSPASRPRPAHPRLEDRPGPTPSVDSLGQRRSPVMVSPSIRMTKHITS